MPNCYYVVSSTPESTGPDASECARAFGGVPRLIAREKSKRRFVVLVWFDTREEADQNLDNIKDCLEEKGHTVHDHDVLEDVRTLGITVDGYEPYSSD